MSPRTSKRFWLSIQYQELLFIHWQSGRYEEIRHVLAAVRALLGTDAPQVVVHEQMREQMYLAITRLRAEFQNEPELLQRAFRALAGGELNALPKP